MTFIELFQKAKEQDAAAVEELLLMYQPLLLKESIVDGILDEDLYQELCIVFLHCVKMFDA